MHEDMNFYLVELAIALMSGKMGTVKDIGAAWDALVEYGVNEKSLRALGFMKPTAEP
jgi:hypothetical protein